MSLSINVEKITKVLIGNEWFNVKEKTFYIDSYEFLEYPDGWDFTKGWHQKDEFGGTLTPFVMHAGGSCGVTASGFAFISEEEKRICGPLTSINAISY